MKQVKKINKDELLVEKANSKDDVTKLLKVFDRATKLQNRSKVLANTSKLTMDSLIDEVNKRLAVDNSIVNNDQVKEKYEIQVEEMVRLWHTTAASMVKVKRSIRLPGFYFKGSYAYDKNLYASPLYGIKEWRRCSNYSPFGWDPVKQIVNCKYKADRLYVRTSEETSLDFIALQSIPQLDQEKVVSFMKITEDTVSMLNSWKYYYDVFDHKNDIVINNLIGTSGGQINAYRVDRINYRNNLKNLDKIVANKKQLLKEDIKQVAKWQPIIEHWKEVNKNFLVLVELKKDKLKI